MTIEITNLDLSRRAVACKAFRWLPGMRYLVLRTSPLESIAGRVPDLTRGWTHPPGMLPDLSDPATLGCLLALVREAWGDPEMHLVLGGAGSGESRVATVVLPIPAGRTEAEALVAALEAAP